MLRRSVGAKGASGLPNVHTFVQLADIARPENAMCCGSLDEPRTRAL
jgi:hypothetical protein